VIPYEQGFRKVGRKCRRGRRARPVGHRDHRKRRGGSRRARLLKREFELRFAPTISESMRLAGLGLLGFRPSYSEAPRAVVAAAGRNPKESYLR
jgi:hypothetical protein